MYITNWSSSQTSTGRNPGALPRGSFPHSRGLHSLDHRDQRCVRECMNREPNSLILNTCASCTTAIIIPCLPVAIHRCTSSRFHVSHSQTHASCNTRLQAMPCVRMYGWMYIRTIGGRRCRYVQIVTCMGNIRAGVYRYVNRWTCIGLQSSRGGYGKRAPGHNGGHIVVDLWSLIWWRDRTASFSISHPFLKPQLAWSARAHERYPVPVFTFIINNNILYV